jgi:hypothetical protein
MYKHLINLCVKYMQTFVQNVECVPQKSSELIWLTLLYMLGWKFFLTLKIRIVAFLVIMQYSMVADLPQYAKNSLPHIQCRSEEGWMKINTAWSLETPLANFKSTSRHKKYLSQILKQNTNTSNSNQQWICFIAFWYLLFVLCCLEHNSFLLHWKRKEKYRSEGIRWFN